MAVQRIAVLAGLEVDAAKLDAFFSGLHAKYPAATIVTGDGRGGEAAVKAAARKLGMTVEVPPLNDAAFGSEALMCQVNDILRGADAIVLVGSTTASRPKRALEILKRSESCMDVERRRPVHKIAAPPPKKRKTPAKAQTMNIPHYA